jgi:hypothetical protein
MVMRANLDRSVPMVGDHDRGDRPADVDLDLVGGV